MNTHLVTGTTDGKLVMEGAAIWRPSCCLAELQETVTGRKQAGGEGGVRALRVCIQALINSQLLPPPPLDAIHAFLGHMPLTLSAHGAYVRVTVTAVCSHGPPLFFVFFCLARLPSCVRVCEASPKPLDAV